MICQSSFFTFLHFFFFFLKDQRYSEVDIKTLSNQRDMLLDKLEEFELANKNLRRLLRETQKKRVGKKASDELEKHGRMIIL